MSGLHLTLFLAYPDCLVAVSLTLITLWLAWALQFWRGYQAVFQVFGGVPGFGGFFPFWLGYAGLSPVSVADRKLYESSLKELQRCTAEVPSLTPKTADLPSLSPRLSQPAASQGLVASSAL